ncbi:MAG: NAD(P)-dependent oxidoreductase [Pseudomonadota bacterium]
MDEAALAGFGPGFEVINAPHLVEARAELLAALSDAAALIVRNRTQVDRALLDAAPALRAVGRLGVGLDNIDVAACKARGIQVCPATGANAASVAEYVITAALMLVRGAFQAQGPMLEGAWPRAMLSEGREIGGLCMGLVGFGATAQAVATRAKALGMAVLAHDPLLGPDDPAWALAERCSLQDVLAGADVLSLHLPLSAQTKGLISTEALAALPEGAVVINAARGGILDEAALAEALKTGRLGGAALDVFEDEPLGPEAAARFTDVPNLILSPHIAGLTRQSNARVSETVVARVKEALS